MRQLELASESSALENMSTLWNNYPQAGCDPHAWQWAQYQYPVTWIDADEQYMQYIPEAGLSFSNSAQYGDFSPLSVFAYPQTLEDHRCLS
jgi:hypothetical protein